MRLASPPCLCVGRGKPRAGLPRRWSCILPHSGRGAPATPCVSTAGALTGAPASGFVWPGVLRDHVALPTGVLCRGPRGAGAAPHRISARGAAGVCRAGRRLPNVPLGGRRGTPGVLSTSTVLGTIKLPIRIKEKCSR